MRCTTVAGASPSKLQVPNSFSQSTLHPIGMDFGLHQLCSTCKPIWIKIHGKRTRMFSPVSEPMKIEYDNDVDSCTTFPSALTPAECQTRVQKLVKPAISGSRLCSHISAALNASQPNPLDLRTEQCDEGIFLSCTESQGESQARRLTLSRSSYRTARFGSIISGPQ